jgi:hypothetical protein
MHMHPYYPSCMHQGECASYRHAKDESDQPIQTVMVQGHLLVVCRMPLFNYINTPGTAGTLNTTNCNEIIEVQCNSPTNCSNITYIYSRSCSLATVECPKQGTNNYLFHVLRVLDLNPCMQFLGHL